MAATVCVQEAKRIAEQRLWRAVIASTLKDWIHGPLRRQREAEEFLFHDDIDYCMVCYQAGIDPENLRSRLRKIRSGTHARGCPHASRN